MHYFDVGDSVMLATSKVGASFLNVGNLCYDELVPGKHPMSEKSGPDLERL